MWSVLKYIPTIAPNSRYINNNNISSMLAEVFSARSKKVKNADQTIAEPIANSAR